MPRPRATNTVGTDVTNMIKSGDASGASMNAMLKAQMRATVWLLECERRLWWCNQSKGYADVAIRGKRVERGWNNLVCQLQDIAEKGKEHL